MTCDRSEFPLIATLRVQQLLMLDDALRGRAGSPKIWNGRAHYRWGSLRWCREGIILEEDLTVLAYCRAQGALVRTETFGLPPLLVGGCPWGWVEGWRDFLPSLLAYESQFGPERSGELEELPVAPLWRHAWWVQLGSRLPERRECLLERCLSLGSRP